MSGSTPPGLGTIVKVAVVFAVFLVLEYLAAIKKLIGDPGLSFNWKIILGLTTPVLLATAWIISSRTGEKSINILAIFSVTYLNLIYLLIPVNSYFEKLIYSGNNTLIQSLLMISLSILTPFLVIAGITSSIYFILMSYSSN